MVQPLSPLEMQQYAACSQQFDVAGQQRDSKQSQWNIPSEAANESGGITSVTEWQNLMKHDLIDLLVDNAADVSKSHHWFAPHVMRKCGFFFLHPCFHISILLSVTFREGRECFPLES